MENATIQQDNLILLGVWNIMPLELWGWFHPMATQHLKELTGVEFRPFLYTRDELTYECVFKEDVDLLQQKFEEIESEEDQLVYIRNIYADFDKKVPKLQQYLEELKDKDFSQLSNEEMITIMDKIMMLWCSVTSQIWYAVFLDIWYPLPEQHAKVKSIAAKARDLTGHLHAESNIVERRLYVEVGKKLSLNLEEMYYLLPSDISHALTTGTSYAEEVRRRQEFCIIATINNNFDIYSAENAEQLFREYNPPSAGKDVVKELKGTPANKGLVTGRVRVIRLDKEFEAFQEGEILVALQTMVHYLPIMKKSKAILTEFGGLTSHAAIVSRELGKPSVVGIPNLVASLKDGDLVEVDANTGVVKVLT